MALRYIASKVFLVDTILDIIDRLWEADLLLKNPENILQCRYRHTRLGGCFLRWTENTTKQKFIPSDLHMTANFWKNHSLTYLNLDLWPWPLICSCVLQVLVYKAGRTLSTLDRKHHKTEILSRQILTWLQIYGRTPGSGAGHIIYMKWRMMDIRWVATLTFDLHIWPIFDLHIWPI